MSFKINIYNLDIILSFINIRLLLFILGLIVTQFFLHKNIPNAESINLVCGYAIFLALYKIVLTYLYSLFISSFFLLLMFCLTLENTITGLLRFFSYKNIFLLTKYDSYRKCECFLFIYNSYYLFVTRLAFIDWAIILSV